MRVVTSAPQPCELVPLPTTGRIHRNEGVVRLGDVDRHGHLRLDGIARVLQDVSRDDTRDAALDRADTDSWVVRRTTIEIRAPLRFDERYRSATFCGGVGPRWAERRVTLSQESGGHVEAAALWVAVDQTSGRPRRLSDGFHKIWASAAQGRKVSARRRIPDPDAVGSDGNGIERRPWPLRRSDIDILDHVNNAAAWVAIDDEIGRLGLRPSWAEIEHAGELPRGCEPLLASTRLVDGVVGIWLEVDGAAAVAAAVGVSSR